MDRTKYYFRGHENNNWTKLDQVSVNIATPASLTETELAADACVIQTGSFSNLQTCPLVESRHLSVSAMACVTTCGIIHIGNFHAEEGIKSYQVDVHVND